VSQLLELEGEDDFACSRAESLKCEPSLLPLSERFLTNRYLSGKMNFCWMSPFGEVAKAGFIVSSSVCGRVSGIEPPTTDIERCYGRDYSQKPLVLPFNIEVMKSPDIVISSLVRFQKFKPLAFGGREPFYELMPFVIPGKETFFAAGDRKVNVVKLSYAVACGNDACHYIEGAPSDIDERPEFDGKRQREGSLA
jgi:hypothetical protein